MRTLIFIEKIVISITALGAVIVGLWFLTRPGPEFDSKLHGLWIPMNAETKSAAEREARVIGDLEEKSHVFRTYKPKWALLLEKERGYLYKYFKDSGLTTRMTGRVKWYTLPDGVLYISFIGDHGEIDYRKARYEIQGDRLRIIGLPEEVDRIDTEYVRATAAETSIILAHRRKITNP